MASQGREENGNFRYRYLTGIVLIALMISLHFPAEAFSKWTYAPEWVLLHIKHQEHLIADTAYVGIGASTISQEAADADAMKRFAASVETEVLSISERTIDEQRGDIKVDRFTVTSQVVTDVSLRGITITDQYYDETLGLYYSLISYNKDDYADMVLEEFKRWLEMELEKEIASHKLEEEKLREAERHRQARHDISMRNRENRRRRIQEKMRLYDEFLAEEPPHRAVTFRNGEVLDDSWELIGRMGLSPFSFEGAGLAIGFWNRLELSGKFNVINNDSVQWQEGALKLQLLNQNGKLTRMSLAFGAVEYDGKFNKTFKTLGEKETRWGEDIKISPMIAGNVSLPQWKYSYLSFYFDYRKLALGINNYLLYDHFGKAISFIGQVDFIQNSDFRVNNHGNYVLFQPAIRFEPDPSLIATFSYEDHRIFIFTLNIIMR